MNTSDFMAMLVVHTGDSLLRLQREAFDALLCAEQFAKDAKAEGWDQHFLESAAERVLDAEAVCAEHGVLGKEC